MAGVEVLANEVQMYLTGSYLKNFSEWESLLYVALLCLIFSLLFFGTRGFIWHIAEVFIAIAAYMTISYFLFSRGWYVPVMPGIFAIILPFSVLHTYSAIRTFYEKEKIRNIFSKHIDRAIVATLIDQ